MAQLTPQLNGHYLTTARILYHMPDYRHVLQEYLWQDYDRVPEFPVLQKFLLFWTREIEGKLHSVHIAHQGLITAAPIRFAAWDGIVQ